MAIIIGNCGDNILTSKTRGDIILGLDGDDTLVALHGFNILLGGDGDDLLTALSSFNILSGGAGDDTLRAYRGWNLLLGGDGDDFLSSSADGNILNGGDGDDSLSVLAGSGNILHGGDGDDVLSVHSDGNTLDGGDGDDVFEILGGSGNAVKGGAGRDAVSYGDTTQGIAVNLAAGTGTGTGTLSGIENVRGGAGDDAIIGDDSDNVLEGAGGNDTIEGGAGNDMVDGGAGDDLIIGGTGAGDDIYQGGDGNDTVSYASTSQGVAASLASGIATGIEIGTDTLIEIENLVGGTGNDTLTGDAFANLLDGGAGEDTIKGGAGNDVLAGGLGVDTLSYEDSPTRVIVNMLSTTTIQGVLPGTASDGFGTTDTISSFQTVIGSAFNDFLQGSSNVSHVLVGGAGNDTLVGSGMSDSIPGAVDDTLLGGAGDDMLRQTRGHDYLDGGTGFNDRVEFTNPNGTSASGINYGGAIGVNVNLGTGFSDADASGSDLQNGPGGNVATILGIEQVFGTAGNDVLTGGSLARAAGGGLVEVFRGNAGADTINGQGADTAQGAFDIDRADYSNSPGPVIVNLGTAPIMVGPEVVAGGTARDGFGTTDTLLHVNHAIGSNFNDTLIGGNPEYDHTFERFEGRGGDDFMDGGSGRDEVSYQNAPGPVTVNLEIRTASGADGNDAFTNMEGIRGSQFNDVLIGSNNFAVVEHFVGNGGDDFIDGGKGIDFASWQGVQLTSGGVNAFIENGFGTVFSPVGIDTLVNIEGLIGTNSGDMLAGGMGSQWFQGRGGSDFLNGGFDSDTADYSMDPGAVTVNLALGTATDGWGGIWELQGFDTLVSIENVLGTQFNDSLTGDANANFIDGGQGDDTIKGGAGNDVLAGGAGIDTLSYADSPARVIVNLFVTSPITIGGVTVEPGHAFDGFGPPIPLPPTDTVSGFETVIGSAFNDHIQGSTNVANLLIGGAGNDTLAGSGASDGISPPVPGAANDTLLGGAGDDVLRQSRGNDVIDGGAGFDRLEFTNNGIAYGGAIGVNVNLAMGTSDADPNNGDAVHGPGGDVATISGIEFVLGTAGNDLFTGGDPLHAPGLAGSGQTEFFQPLGGSDTLTGMAGRGWSAAVDYSSNNSFQPVTVVLGNSNNLGAAVDGFGFIDTLTDVDVVRGGFGNDTLVGGSYSQGATGVFVETYRGNAGNDTIDGGGSDTVIGAYGVTDRVEYGNSPFGVVVNTGVAPISGTPYGTVNPGTARDGFDFLGGGTDTLIDINVVRGSNSIFGDLLVGGNPKFDNIERFEGLAGNDTLMGGSGNDEADYGNSPAGVSVNIGTGTASDGFGGTDTLVSIEWARGGSFNDTLIGGANALERFTGGAGNDSINGGSMAGVNYASFVLGTSGASASVANGVGTAGNDGQSGTDTLVNINGLWGSNFNDTLTGGLGDQWFVGQGGDDLIGGGDGIDTVSYMADPNGATVNLGTNSATDGWGGIWGLQGTDTLTSIENVEGSSFNDSITGDANANRIEGLGGNDTIKGGAGADSLVGGADSDTLLYDDSPSRVIVNMFNTSSVVVGGITVLAGTASDGFGATDTISGFENVIGSGFNDFIQANTSINRVEGNAGNDTLAGGGGVDAADDTLLGGAGDDVLRQTHGHDSIVGGDGFDRLEFVGNGINYGSGIGVSVNLGAGTSDADPFNGDAVNGPGGDIATVSGIEHVLGTAGGDSLTGDANANLLEGGAGDDTFQGGAGNDMIDGGASGAGGGDRLSFSNATTGISFTLVQSASDTVVDLSAFGLGTDTYRSIEGVVGSSFNDTLTGSSADDRLQGGAGNDTIDGGAGSNDRIAFLDATGAIDFTLVQSPSDTVVNLSAVGLGSDTYRNIEGVVGTNFNDTLAGSSGNDFISGAGGNDSIHGADGDDTLRGGSGNDTMDGGAGIDRLDFSNLGLGINFTVVQSPSDTVVNLFGIDTYRNIEGVIGTDFVDMLIGSAGNDALDGGAGDDTLQGGAGDDTIDGGAGSNDRISFSDATGAINFNLVQSPSDTVVNLSTVGLGTDTYRNIESVIGTSFNDTLTGSSANDRLQGGPGDDTIDGAAGSNDRIAFLDATGAINFTLVQSPSDTVVNLSAVGLGSDTYRNIEGVIGSVSNDTLTGSSGNDFIIGAGGNDSIDGAGGDDTLRGSGGNDTMDGGAGIDRLDFATAGAGINFTLNQGTNPGDPANGLWSTGALPGGIGTDSYKNIEGVIGTDFNDTLTGSSLADVLQGGGGTDVMTGNAGMDTFKFNATSDSSAALSFSDVITDFAHGTDKIDLSAIDANSGVDSDQAFAFVALANENTVANSITWSEDVANLRTILHIDNDGDAAAEMQIVLQGMNLGLTDTDFIL